MNMLIIGGSGFLSGTLARLAVSQQHDVTVVTRGQRPVPDKIEAIAVDRHDRQAFGEAIDRADRRWDLVVDCICFNADDARQDLEAFAGRTDRLVVISTDFVFDPEARQSPQPEDGVFREDDSYGAHKRRAERVLLDAGDKAPPWFVLRPGHIYGPDSELGCLPLHSRDPELVDRLRRGETLRLVAGGELEQQPVFAPDLAETILAAADGGAVPSGILNIAGPDAVPARRYYELVARVLGVECKVEACPVDEYLAEHPEHRQFCVDRVLALGRLRESKLPMPATPLADGLGMHVEDLLAKRSA